MCNPFIYEFQVVLYNANLTNLNNLTGDQIGSYFGYSVASGDLNGDGLDDVIIGAPMWTNYQVMGKFETGKVFVAYQSVNVSLLSDTSAGGQSYKRLPTCKLITTLIEYINTFNQNNDT